MRGNKSTVMQDLYFKKIPEIKSSVTEVECHVCGKGLQDGISITAKTLSSGIELFCDAHY
jgi:hypothetical protein